MTVVYIQEEFYRGDNDMTPQGFLFDNKESAREWLKSKGYTKLEPTTYPANQMERWEVVRHKSLKKALVFEATFKGTEK